jgi:hypothetical protein
VFLNFFIVLLLLLLIEIVDALYLFDEDGSVVDAFLFLLFGFF